jgi:rhodanese-related sulfurtransferase
LIDVRNKDAFAADPRFVPSAMRRPHETVSSWAREFAGRATVAICENGRGQSEGVAAWLRGCGAASAEVLVGGHEAWTQAGLPLVPESKLPRRDPQGRTVWVTRSRPKIDRVACPWLIRRFVDPSAVFLLSRRRKCSRSRRFGGAPFDIEGVFWTHRGERCTFDTILDELRASDPPLREARGDRPAADTDRLDLAPEAAGLLSSLALAVAQMYSDDLGNRPLQGWRSRRRLLPLARDASDETHRLADELLKNKGDRLMRPPTPASPFRRRSDGSLSSRFSSRSSLARALFIGSASRPVERAAEPA